MSLDNLFEPQSGESVSDLVHGWLAEDTRIREAADRRRGYASALAEIAFGQNNGQKTVHLPASDGSQVKIEFGTEWKVVNESEMATIRELLGEQFDEVFATSYKPKLKALKLFLNTVFPDERLNVAKELIRQAVQEQDKSPYVSAEKRA